MSGSLTIGGALANGIVMVAAVLTVPLPEQSCFSL